MKRGSTSQCWGEGWPNGRIDHDEMVRLFGASAINLNLSNSSTLHRTLRFRLGALARGRFADARQARPRPSQIKGRTFEVPGSGGFLLTESVPHLEEYFVPGREVGVFTERGRPRRADRLLARPSRPARGSRRGWPPAGARRAHLRPSLRGDLRRRRPRMTRRQPYQRGNL